MSRTRSGVEHGNLDVGSYRRVIEGQGRSVQASPVRLETILIDELPVLELELHQVNVNRVRIFREVLEVPLFGRADLRELGDVPVEMLPVDEHRHGRLDIALLLVQGEEFWIPDAVGRRKRKDADECGGKRMWMHRRCVG